MKGFLRFSSYKTSVLAELRAMKDGLMLALNLGLTKLHIGLGAKCVVNMLRNN